MKIVIATCGTRGDIQPLIALAQALARRGHQALIAAPSEHGTWVENCGCAFQALGSDFTEMLSRYPQVHTLRPMLGFLGFLRSEIRKQLSQLAAERLAAAINQCVCGPGYYDRASRIAEEIEKQDSLRLAVDYIEKTYFNG